MNKPIPPNEFEAHYPADWVVIQNKIRECFKGMSLDEKRLFILATPYARTTKVKGGDCIIYQQQSLLLLVISTLQLHIQHLSELQIASLTVFSAM